MFGINLPSSSSRAIPLSAASSSPVHECHRSSRASMMRLDTALSYVHMDESMRLHEDKQRNMESRKLTSELPEADRGNLSRGGRSLGQREEESRPASTKKKRDGRRDSLRHAPCAGRARASKKRGLDEARPTVFGSGGGTGAEGNTGLGVIISRIIHSCYNLFVSYLHPSSSSPYIAHALYFVIGVQQYQSGSFKIHNHRDQHQDGEPESRQRKVDR